MYCLDEAALGTIGSIVQNMAVHPLRGDAEEGKQAGKADNSVHCKEGDEEHVDAVDHGFITKVVRRNSNGIHDRNKGRHY